LKTNDGKLVVISGTSRTGKTAKVRELLQNEKSVWAWDPEDQWAHEPGFLRVTNRKQLADVMQSVTQNKVAFVAGGDLSEGFDFFCQCAYFRGRYVVDAITIIAEELADVTTPAKAPQPWGLLVRRGLKRGISIYAISQRWSEADKTAFGNATEYYMFMLSSGDDVRYLERKTMIEKGLLETLEPLQFYHYHTHTKKIERGQLAFKPDKV
jgi:hypothetical protein